MKIVFDPAIDGGAWPGVLGGRTAVAGEAWLGPLGLLERLEGELGLGARHVSSIQRTCDLAARLASRSGWWRSSYDADPIGTCDRLLADRDTLALWGWHGERASERLADLWSVTEDALPGVPDRLRDIDAALASRSVDIATIEVMSPLASFTPRWQRVLRRLADAGVEVRELSVPWATSTGDLAAARSSTFSPVGDGTLTLVRPHGPLAAADEIAASLAAMVSLDGVLVIGGDAVLDAALERHGLPRLGARTAPPASVTAIRLVVEAAFEPMEPADLHALLCLDPGPVPRRVAARLVRALDRFPGRRSEAWREALRAGLEACDETRRTAIEARVAALLAPAAQRTAAIAASEISARFHVLANWARGRVEREPGLEAIARLAEQARGVLEVYGATELSLLALRRLCDELDDGAVAGPAYAGLAAIGQPGAVLAPADTIVWWGFTRDRAPRVPRLRLTNSERSELARFGVTPPDLGAVMESEAVRWRRPLEMASRSLVLVSPLTGEGGEPSFPHPLWDELCAAMPRPADAAKLEHRRAVAPAVAQRIAIPSRPLANPATSVRTAPLALRDRESPSSIERLLGCSLAWALHYPARLERGLSAGPSAPTPLLFGNLAHRLLEQVFRAGACSADEAAKRAHALVDSELLDACESLALPRYQVERTAVRRAIVQSARALGSFLATSGAQIRGLELELEGTLDGVALGGRADLVLDGPAAVIDLKWGRSSVRDKLATGTALQLAIYAHLLGVPDVAYFALQHQELWGPANTTLPDVRVHGSATPVDTWRAAATSLAARRSELAAGELVAPGADGTDEVKSALDGERLVIAPSCGYCALGTVCGRTRCT